MRIFAKKKKKNEQRRRMEEGQKEDGLCDKG